MMLLNNLYNLSPYTRRYQKEENVQTIRTWTDSKNSDLYATPELDTGVKNSQIWHTAQNKQI